MRRKHEHDWTAWWTEIHKRSTITKNGEYNEWYVTVNVRRCILPKCRIMQELPASEVKR